MKNKENLRHFMTQPQRPIDSAREHLGKFHDFLCMEVGSLSVNKKKVSEGSVECKIGFSSYGWDGTWVA